jgi:phosphatidylglycerophosphate synthase
LHILPNAFSVARLILGLAFPLLPADWRWGVIVLAAITDAFDGWTARWLGAESNLGRLLDPLADKVFVLAVAGVLLAEGAIRPLWALGVACRDLVVLMGLAYLTATRQWAVGRRLRPSALGKATTALQFVLLVVLVIENQAPLWLLSATVLLSSAAAVDYTRKLVRLKLPPC